MPPVFFNAPHSPLTLPGAGAAFFLMCQEKILLTSPSFLQRFSKRSLRVLQSFSKGSPKVPHALCKGRVRFFQRFCEGIRRSSASVALALGL